MASPEDAYRPLISFTFSWAKIRNLPVSFRTVQRLFTVGRLCSRSMNARIELVGLRHQPKGIWKTEAPAKDDYR
jgi:hypothetical protein